MFNITCKHTEKSNANIRELNALRHAKRADPTQDAGAISANEDEDPISTLSTVLELNSASNPSNSNPQILSSNDPPLTPEAQEKSPNSLTSSWPSAIASDPTVLTSILNTKGNIIDYSTLGPIYKLANISKNEHQLDPKGIPNAVLQMAHSEVYIPLLMLTTSSLNRICNNDNIKFVKVPNSIVHQTLNPTQFSSEDSLSSDDWAQAYHNWLTLAEPSVSVSWHEHCNKMCADQHFSRWFPAWHNHDKQLHSQFICKPFLVDPKSPTYIQSFERAHVDLLARCQLSTPPSSNHSFRNEALAIPFGLNVTVTHPRHFASAVASSAIKHLTAPQPTPATLNVPSWSNGKTSVLSPTLERNSASDLMSVTPATTPIPSTLNTRALSVATTPMVPLPACVIDIMTELYSIPTPYKPDGWRLAL
ncbi:hypothetical protein K439DRAFT_1619117 [Ramaria rubella]|nr:hypothetical protein K439DRAFT_1619117 [Ramaria rubella]